MAVNQHITNETMHVMIIISVFLSLIFLKALTDSFVYFSWTKGTYAKAAHILKFIPWIVIYIFGHLCDYAIFSIETFAMVVCYVGMNFGFFDLFYTNITGSVSPGNSDVFDSLFAKYPILNNLVLRFFITFASICFLIVITASR